MNVIFVVNFFVLFDNIRGSFENGIKLEYKIALSVVILPLMDITGSNIISYVCPAAVGSNRLLIVIFPK